MSSTSSEEPPPSRVDRRAIHLSETDASSGKKLGTMRYVLGISLVALIAVLAIVLFIHH
jgi:hypothetical protein